jgi:hypothetical protein
MKDATPIGITSVHEGRLAGKGTVGNKRFYDENYKAVVEAQSSVMQQLAILDPYIEGHMNESLQP